MNLSCRSDNRAEGGKMFSGKAVKPALALKARYARVCDAQ